MKETIANAIGLGGKSAVIPSGERTPKFATSASVIASLQAGVINDPYLLRLKSVLYLPTYRVIGHVAGAHAGIFW